MSSLKVVTVYVDVVTSFGEGSGVDAHDVNVAVHLNGATVIGH